MKKILAISIILCLAFSAFAAGTVKVGGAFNYAYGKTAENEEEELPETLYKAYGFGFDVAGSYDINEKLSVWADFNMEFPADAKGKDGFFGDEWVSIKETFEGTTYYSDIKFNSFGIAAGAAYKIALDAPVDVKVGGGLFLERFKFFGKYYYNNGDFKSTILNAGITLLADASYAINENFAVGLTVMPRLGLFNIYKETYDFEDDNYDSTSKAKGFALSFSVPVVIGASYSF